ncbi:AraC family transcriptional regulator [Streptococcus merionis]|nr:AraC family transcriptional regulator [Streptococcus merionis]
MISDQYEIYHVKDDVNQTQTLYHYHDCYEIHATLEGEAVFYIDGEQFDINAGTILLIPANKMHRIMKQSSEYFERVYIFMTPVFLKRYSTRKTNLEACFGNYGLGEAKILKSNPDELRQQLDFITFDTAKDEFGVDVTFEQALVRYIIFLNRLVLSNNSELHPKSNEINERIDEMIKYISEHLGDDLTLEEMESHFYVSKYYITREFKKHTGYTFHQFVLKKRLLYSKYLLRERKNASQIFSDCGFISYPHFLKAFKKEFKMTPKEFLNLLQDNEKIHLEHFETKHYR